MDRNRSVDKDEREAHVPLVRRTLSGKRIPRGQEHGSWGTPPDDAPETLRQRLAKLAGAMFKAAPEPEPEDDERPWQPGDPVQIVVPDGDGDRRQRRAEKRYRKAKRRKHSAVIARDYRRRVREGLIEP